MTKKEQQPPVDPGRPFVLRNGEVNLLLRALRMYMAEYQRMVGGERNEGNKANLREYITAAEAIFVKLHPATRDRGQKE